MFHSYMSRRHIRQVPLIFGDQCLASLSCLVRSRPLAVPWINTLWRNYKVMLLHYSVFLVLHIPSTWMSHVIKLLLIIKDKSGHNEYPIQSKNNIIYSQRIILTLVYYSLSLHRAIAFKFAFIDQLFLLL